MKNCKICNRLTFNTFNINLKSTPICENCADLITVQQVLYWKEQSKNNDPSEEVINIYNLQVENMKALDSYLKYKPNGDTKQVAKLRVGITKLQTKLQRLGFEIVVQTELPSKKTVYDLKIVKPKKK